MFWHITIFLGSLFLLWAAVKLVIKGLIRIARFLGWREFAVAFFAMAFAASLPNLVVGVSAALRGIPELSLGDVVGNNIAILTLGLGLAALITRGGIPAESRMVQTSSMFVMVAALLPLILILDGTLSRIDGILLIALFIFYTSWLFSKEERFTKVYDDADSAPLERFRFFFLDLVKIFWGLMIFIIAGQGIVFSAQYFAESFSLSLILIGVFITGLGSALPEIYFSVVSARKGETWMILGNVMGAAIVPATLVLGIVSLIQPIQISNFSTIALARLFIIAAAILFPVFVRSKQKVEKREGFILIFIYITFLITTIFFSKIFT